MNTGEYPDPFQDAMQHGLRLAMEAGYIVAAGTQIYLTHKKTQARIAAERDERVRRALTAQTRADRDAARASWAPALDPHWLSEADLFQAARTWGAAMPYADRAVPWYDPAAAAALRKTEERLRHLHPHAMARYDRLRGDGMSPADAMRETAPLFTRPPNVHDGTFTPRPALDAPAPAPGGDGPGPHGGGPGVPTAGQPPEQRAQQIIGALQQQARANGGQPFTAAQLRAILQAVTSLPPAAIDHIVPPGPAAGLTGTGQHRAASAEQARATGRDGATLAAGERTQNLTGARDAAATADAAAARAARPWERDFPVSIHDAVARTAPTGVAASSASPAPTLARTLFRRRPGS
jgi:hypothetical protein